MTLHWSEARFLKPTPSINTLASVLSNAWNCLLQQIFILGQAWTVCVCHRLWPERPKHYSCDARILANFHTIGNDCFISQHRYLRAWTRKFNPTIKLLSQDNNGLTRCFHLNSKNGHYSPDWTQSHSLHFVLDFSGVGVWAWTSQM